MTDCLAEIEQELDARSLATQCRRGNCGVSMQGINAGFLLVDLDLPGAPIAPTDTRCDYLFFGEHDSMCNAVALEMKSGRARTGTVERQLQAGAQAADALCPRVEAVVFTPVLVGGTLHKESWRRMKIRFRGDRERVYRAKCGQPMAAILDDAQGHRQPR